jgi:hypothetical protein
MDRCLGKEPQEPGSFCSPPRQRFDCRQWLLEIEKRTVRLEARYVRPRSLLLSAKGPKPTDGATRNECVGDTAFDAARGILVVERISVCAAGGDACDDVTLWEALHFPPAKALR